MTVAAKRSKKKPVEKSQAPCAHSYGGFRGFKRWDGRPGAVLMCSKCKGDYFPAMNSLIGQETGRCPHPVFGEFDADGRAECSVCGARKQFIAVPYVGGPHNGETDWLLPSAIEDPWLWPMSATSEGQKPSKDGSTTLFNYCLRMKAGLPYWDGRKPRATRKAAT